MALPEVRIPASGRSRTFGRGIVVEEELLSHQDAFPVEEMQEPDGELQAGWLPHGNVAGVAWRRFSRRTIC
ncbi:hypothetical protein AB7M37_004695 [Sinorhizobium fredii]